MGLALAVSLLPGVPDRLGYDRSAVVEDAQWWRVLSAQLVHWNARMALTDLLVVLLLGLWAERRLPTVTRALLLTGLPLIGLGIHLGAPGLQYYRGSSPLASALFVLVALTVVFEDRSRPVRALAVAALALLALKLLREAWTGEAFFAGPLPEGVVALPLSHLLGAACGAVFAVIGRRFVDPD